MDALIPIIATPAIAEALKAWGSFALVLIALGAALLFSERRARAKDAKIEKLEAAIAALQDLRLQDAREMIRVAKNGAETIAARAEGDARFRDLMSEVLEVAHLKAAASTRAVPAAPPPTLEPFPPGNP